MPTLASTSRAQLRYIEESVFGTTPGVGPHYRLRMTGESLSYALDTEKSKEIRSDRQISDLILTGAQVNGGVNFELSYNEFDDLIEAALQGTWAVYGTAGVGSTFEADFTTTTITAAVAPTGANAFTTLAQGQWFKLNAPSDPNDGKFFKVHETTAPTSTVITVSDLTPLTAGTDVANCSLATSRLVNGTTQRSFTLEREHSDIDKFFAFRGATVSKMSLSLASKQIVTGSFDFLGKDQPAVGSDTTLPGADTASQTYGVMNAVSNVGMIVEGDAELTGTFIKSMTLSLDNKLRVQDAIGVLGAAGIGSGTSDITGSLEVYLADGTLYDKFVANSLTALSFRVVDNAGNGYVFDFPAVKYSDAKVNAGAIDQDAMLSLPFQAIMDATSQQTVRIYRVGVAASRGV